MLTRADLPSVLKQVSEAASQEQQTQRSNAASEQEAALRKYLQGQKEGSIGADGTMTPGTDLLGKQAEQTSADTIKAGAQAREFKAAQEGFTNVKKNMPPGSRASVKYGDTSIMEGEPNPAAGARQATKQENAYAKNLTPYSDAIASVHAIEDSTNSDGKGGVLTNGDAQLKSFGKYASSLSDKQVAIAEGLHMLPSGAAEERKTVSRYQLALGHSLNGARMNPMMQSMIKDSMGQMASGDPQLVAKGIRGAAKILGQTVKTVQAGFDDQTRETVHGRLGGDPSDVFKSIHDDGPAGVSTTSPPPAGDQQAPMSMEDWKKANGR